MFETNSLIRASAGTGKTFALATRFIRLLMFDKVNPETIIALTFSRAAAQEIYEKILKRLADAALDDNGAEREWEILLDDYKNDKAPNGREKYEAILSQNFPHDANAFRILLRRLVETQHLGTIATIDSFLLRFYQNFPKEMGFQNVVKIIDTAGEIGAIENALKTTLSRKNGGEAIAKAFRSAKEGNFSRTCLSSISTILHDGWRKFVLSHPDCDKWSEETICKALGIPKESICPDLAAVPIGIMKRANKLPVEEQFVRLVGSYTGETSFSTRTKVDEMMEFFWNNPEETRWSYTYYGDVYSVDVGSEGAKIIRDAIEYMMNLYLYHQIKKVMAKIRLAKVVEDEYNKVTRRAGNLTFDDITKNTIGSDFLNREDAIRNVEFRFDSKFNHWALDEFQDTSELQWERLKCFISEVSGEGYNGGDRTAMVVGDLKQSIYTWRGASSLPFEEVSDWPQFKEYERNFQLSYRYGPNITALVNKIFGKENILEKDFFNKTCKLAAEEWNKGWINHVSKQPADYVKVVYSDSKIPDKKESVLIKLYEELKPVWERHENENSSESIAIIVRSNTEGRQVADYLKKQGLPVVWEGVNLISGLPVVQSILSLVKLADHPGDTVSWKMVNDLFKVREKVFPELTSIGDVSSAVSRMLARGGLARTLKDICIKFENDFEETSVAPERLHQLVEIAAMYEERPSNNGSIDDFLKFLEHMEKREIASSSKVIRVLSIHRSKGLGFDHLFVPIIENKRYLSSITNPKPTSPLSPVDEKNDRWILPHISKFIAQFNPDTKKAYEKMSNNTLRESLRTYYVALTRAKKSMYVILTAKEKPDDHTTICDLIASGAGKLPYEAGEAPTFKSIENDDDSAPATIAVWKEFGEREKVERVSPSPSHFKKDDEYFLMSSSLFDVNYGAAAKQGLDIHADYQKIEWADGEELNSLPDAFRSVFEKPSPDAIAWREKEYEFFENGRWETGRFDRVVLTEKGDEKEAVIYDFKTNTPYSNESADDFAKRMKEMYFSQMDAYRRALSKMANIKEAKIKTILVLDSTKTVVNVHS